MVYDDSQPRYKLLYRIGQGGYGDVYLAESIIPSPFPYQALKFPKKTVTNRKREAGYYQEEEVNRTPAEIQAINEDMAREAEVYRQLDPNCEAPSLVRLLRYSNQGIRFDSVSGESFDGNSYIAMEFT